MKHAPVTFATIAHFSISILGRSLFLDAANAHRNTSRPSRRPRLLRSTHASYARAANIRNDFGSLFSPFIFWVTLFRLFFLSPSLFLLYCDSHIPVTPMSVLSVANDIINVYFIVQWGNIIFLKEEEGLRTPERVRLWNSERERGLNGLFFRSVTWIPFFYIFTHLFPFRPIIKKAHCQIK